MLADLAEAMASNEEVATNPVESPMEVQQEPPEVKVNPFEVERSPWILLGMAAKPVEHLGNCFCLLQAFVITVFAPFHFLSMHLMLVIPVMLYDSQSHCSEN